MTVTIWNTNTNAIATRREITGWTTPVGDASPERIYSDPVALERMTAAIWTRPRWNATMRSAPWSYGANNFLPGERILTVIDVRPTLGEYDRLGAMGAGVPDLDAGTMTYTWAKISADAFDPATHHTPVWDGSSWDAAVAKDSGDLAADLAARKAAMLEQCRLRFRAVRDAGTAIDFGGGPVPIQTTEGAANDIQRLHDDLRLREAAGAVDPTQDIATANYDIVPGVTIAAAGAMREAVAAHWRATWNRDAALGAAINAAADHDALDLIDVAAGAIDGVGGWA